MLFSACQTSRCFDFDLLDARLCSLLGFLHLAFGFFDLVAQGSLSLFDPLRRVDGLGCNLSLNYTICFHPTQFVLHPTQLLSSFALHFLNALSQQLFDLSSRICLLHILVAVLLGRAFARSHRNRCRLRCSFQPAELAA